MHSSAPERSIAIRAQGVALALLVQALFLWALLFAAVRQTERVGEREAILFLRPPPAPSMIDARGPRRAYPGVAAPIPLLPLPQSGPRFVAPSDLRGFGRALFGCAPEHYAELPPDERKHCPKPGEGLAVNPPPDLLADPSHVKDNARWANALAHKQSPRQLPGGFLFPLAALGAILDGSITERSSAFRDPEKWPVYSSGPKPPRDGERSQEAGRNDPAQIGRQAPGTH
jgi:hypothetical protein